MLIKVLMRQMNVLDALCSGDKKRAPPNANPWSSAEVGLFGSFHKSAVFFGPFPKRYLI